MKKRRAGCGITWQAGGMFDSKDARKQRGARWTSRVPSRSSSRSTIGGRSRCSCRAVRRASRRQGVAQVLRGSHSGQHHRVVVEQHIWFERLGAGLACSRGVSSHRPWVPWWRSPQPRQLSTYSAPPELGWERSSPDEVTRHNLAWLGDFSLTLASGVRRMWRIQKKEMDGLAATKVIGGRVRFCYCCFSRCLAYVILANVVVLETLMSSEPLVCNFDVLIFFAWKQRYT
jgi:hypothetical protein